MLNNIIYNENCLDAMKRMDCEIIDLVITSPAYDDLRKYKGYSFDFENIAKELYRIIKPGGVVVWVVGDATIKGSETGTSFKQALYFKEIGFNLHDTMIYEKNTTAFPSNKKSVRYTQIFEFMFVFSKGKPKTINLLIDKKNKWAGSSTWSVPTKRQKNGNLTSPRQFIGKIVNNYGVRNNIWRYICSGGFGQKDKIAYNHPATFPEKLAEDHILTWSNVGDMVFDPMAGSGTTLKMALINNRKAIGCEISKEYCEIIKERISMVIKKPTENQFFS